MGRAYGSGVYGAGIYPGNTFEEQMASYGPHPIVLLEVEFVSGTQYFSSEEVRFQERPYRGKVVRMGSIRRACQQNLGLYEISSVEVLLADVDTTLIDLSETEAIKGRRARVKLGSKKLPLADFVTVFEGSVDDFGSAEYGFRLVIKDRLWTLPPRPDTGYITTTLFPNALPAHVGRPLPVCYGTHSDTDTTDARNRGAWPTSFVDVTTSNRYFLIAYHAVSEINEVYAYTPGRGSVVLLETTDYVAYPNGFINGVRCAFIAITNTGFTDKVTDLNGTLGEVTVNVSGKEVVGDGSGSLISNPIAILRDILGNYLGSPDLNGDKFSEAETVCTTRGYSCRGGYFEETGTQEFLAGFADSFNLRIFPDREGKIACDIFQPAGPGDVVQEVREQWEVLSGSWSVDYQSNIQSAEDAQIVNKVDYKHNYHWAKRIFRGNDTYSDADSIASYGVKRLTLDLLWSGTTLAAQDIAYRYIILYRNPVAHMNVAMPLSGMNVELTDQVDTTHDSSAGSYDGRRFDVIERTFDPQTLTVQLRGRDVEEISRGGYFFGDSSEAERVSDGTIAVTNGSANINASGATSFITAGVEVGDIIEILSPTNSANRKMLKITSVTDLDTVVTANTVWVNESGMSYRILRSWLTQTDALKKYGHLADSSTEQFSNGDDGFVLL